MSEKNIKESQIIKILIFEGLKNDSALLIRILEEGLKRNFETIIVRDKNDLIIRLDSSKPDLVLFDINLPSFDWSEAVEIINEKNPNIPVIAVTENEETSAGIKESGVADYVLKDNLIRLVPAINNALEKNRFILVQNETRQILLQNEKELDAIFNNSPAIMVVLDSKGRINKINKAGLNFSGKRFADALGKSVGYILDCEFHSTLMDYGKNEGCEKCPIKEFIIDNIKLDKVKKQEIEFCFRKTGNQTIYYILAFFEPLSEPPEPTFLLTMIDMTERKKSLKNLAESEQKFKELTDTLPEIVFEVDKDLNFTFLNKLAFKKFNLSQQLLEQGKLSVYNIVDSGFGLIIKDLIYRGYQSENIPPFDYKVSLPDGTSGFFNIYYNPIMDEGKLNGFRGIAVDITERKKMEEKLSKHSELLEELVKERTQEFERKAKQLEESQQALSFLLDDVNESREELLASNREISILSQALEQSPSTVVITDTEGNIEYVNHQFSMISGYSFEEVKGKNPRILNSHTHPKEFFTAMWQKIKSGQKWTGEICNRKKNGEIYWEYSSISPLRNPKQEITNFVAVKEDITEKKTIEQKLKEYTKELELFNKLMVDRELRIIEMKEEVNSLCEKLGSEIKYPPLWNEISDQIS